MLGVLAIPRAASAETVEDRFAAAANLIAENREAEAARRLEAVAREAPDHSLAPEALFAAAELHEERLAEPGRALELYREIEQRYPDSRRALAASRRAAGLSSQVGPDAKGLEAQRRFMAVRQRATQRPEEAIAAAEALLREFPDWAGAPAVALWIAGLDARAGRYESALRRYLAAAERYAQPEARFDALRGAAEMALRLGRYGEAERTYRRMDAAGEPGRQIAIEEGLAAVEQARGRGRWLWIGAAAVLAGFLALALSLLTAVGSLRAAARALWPPPGEVLYLGPVVAILSAVSFADYQGLGPAVTIVSAGGIAAAWLSGASLRRRGGRRAAIVHALAAAVSILALFYIAVYSNDLIDPVADTLRYGPER